MWKIYLWFCVCCCSIQLVAEDLPQKMIRKKINEFWTEIIPSKKVVAFNEATYDIPDFHIIRNENGAWYFFSRDQFREYLFLKGVAVKPYKNLQISILESPHGENLSAIATYTLTFADGSQALFFNTFIIGSEAIWYNGESVAEK